MPGRPNHRGWIVLESIQASSDGLCVDFFQHLEGGYGFEQFRQDPEDLGAWTQLSYFSSQRFPTMLDAVTAAKDAINWLSDDPIAGLRLQSWIRQQLP
ncbi:MAG TPA: hypothetical protein VIJ34_03960 [Acidimicrobiales bacterium]